MTAAGWYPDGAGQTRYWDGRGWTSYVQVVTPKAAPKHPDWWKWLIICLLFPPVLLWLPFGRRSRGCR